MNPEAEAAILAAVRAIPRGQVASYGGVASAAGLPRRARLVGRVLREADTTPKLPWHRVVHADGTLAFPPDSRLFDTQRERLQSEGVILQRQRVPRRYFGDPDHLDALLWGPE